VARRPGGHDPVHIKTPIGTLTVKGFLSGAEVQAKRAALAASRAAAKAKAEAKRQPETFKQVRARVGRDAERRLRSAS
jgi:hypothetical protein